MRPPGVSLLRSQMPKSRRTRSMKSRRLEFAARAWARAAGRFLAASMSLMSWKSVALRSSSSRIQEAASRRRLWSAVSRWHSSSGSLVSCRSRRTGRGAERGAAEQDVLCCLPAGSQPLRRSGHRGCGRWKPSSTRRSSRERGTEDLRLEEWAWTPRRERTAIFGGVLGSADRASGGVLGPHLCEILDK